MLLLYKGNGCYHIPQEDMKFSLCGDAISEKQKARIKECSSDDYDGSYDDICDLTDYYEQNYDDDFDDISNFRITLAELHSQESEEGEMLEFCGDCISNLYSKKADIKKSKHNYTKK